MAEMHNKGSSADAKLGLFSVIMLVIGGVIGSGIFRKSGGMLNQLGSVELLFVVWTVAGAMTMFGVLTVAEISSMIPETGGQYVYFKRIYGPYFAFLYGWACLVVIQTGTIAALAFVFAEHSAELFPITEIGAGSGSLVLYIPFIGQIRPFDAVGIKVIASVVVIMLTTVNYFGVRFGAIVQNGFTLAKIAGLLTLVACAFALPRNAVSLSTAQEISPPSGFFRFLTAFALALQGAFWGYEGWIKASFIGGEVKSPQSTIPRATIVATFVVIAIYLLVNAAYVWVLPANVMAQSKLVAADAAQHMFKGGSRFIAVLVMISTFGAMNAVILASSRVYFSMARNNALPHPLAHSHPKFNTPSVSLGVQAAWAVILIFSGTFDNLTNMLVFVGWIFYAAAAFGVFVLRIKSPRADRPYKVPLYPWIPGLFVLFACSFVILTFSEDILSYSSGASAFSNCMLGTVLVFAGSPIYLYCLRKQRKTENPGPQIRPNS
jgi:basic amino acid/polyamine antiporter, APA family